MKQLLAIHASGRVQRSVTRQLTQRFIDQWRSVHADGDVILRDVGQAPPPTVSEAWIAGAYSDASERDEAMREAIAVSDQLIDEVFAADVIVIGAPIYNFGMPAQLKAWVDQVVRINRTFEMNFEAENPYVSLVPSKPVVVLVSAGDIELHPGGVLAELNHMEPHLRTALSFIGLTDLHFVRTGNEEFKDERHRASVDAAYAEIADLAARLPAGA
ncbi:FMN-dependent NADH-azoreductase [Mucisphaera calidilacus]|uniref:FMN dependent NADH:quinone oxidoreductase n=1 Tax=Mucisphaera calidilacus TaxID=2527982 RepID=A0A518BZY5_9BACT|nr:NAD(P)H-dependent oxidoreductase [Mucisphaera calidilacus]QDU72537.1 FMN-dependent NADH-azoreductase 1 [Mucisphaera calidilacus]